MTDMREIFTRTLRAQAQKLQKHLKLAITIFISLFYRFLSKNTPKHAFFFNTTHNAISALQPELSTVGLAANTRQDLSLSRDLAHLNSSMIATMTHKMQQNCIKSVFSFFTAELWHPKWWQLCTPALWSQDDAQFFSIFAPLQVSLCPSVILAL